MMKTAVPVDLAAQRESAPEARMVGRVEREEEELGEGPEVLGAAA